MLWIVATVFAVALPAFAKSVRAIHPQLIGVDAVALNFSSENLVGLDTDALDRAIRSTLEQGGVKVQEAAPTTLFVRITYQQLPACPEFVAFRTYVALSENVVVHRGKQSETVYVDTWHESEDFIESTSMAGKVAQESVLGLVDYFLNAAQYTREVMKKTAAPPRLATTVRTDVRDAVFYNGKPVGATAARLCRDH